MTTAQQTPLLGVGLYTPAEAALYARIRLRLLQRWFFGTNKFKPALHSEIELRGHKFISFLDFVQALAVREIRREYHVPLQRIRQAVAVAEEYYAVKYPFARPHTTFIYGRDIVIQLEDEKLYQLSGKHVGHQMIRPVLELYMKSLSFGPDRLANCFTAFTHGEYTVEMNPEVRFGEPMVTSCGYSAIALWEAAKAEGGIESAAEVCGVEREEVVTACRFYDHLKGNAAA